jgi:hypothetical protein
VTTPPETAFEAREKNDDISKSNAKTIIALERKTIESSKIFVFSNEFRQI